MGRRVEALAPTWPALPHRKEAGQWGSGMWGRQEALLGAAGQALLQSGVVRASRGPHVGLRVSWAFQGLPGLCSAPPASEPLGLWGPPGPISPEPVGAPGPGPPALRPMANLPPAIWTTLSAPTRQGHTESPSFLSRAPSRLEPLPSTHTGHRGNEAIWRNPWRDRTLSTGAPFWDPASSSTH